MQDQAQAPEQQATTPAHTLPLDSEVGAEFEHDIDRYLRAETLREEIKRRQTYGKERGEFSARYVVEVAGQRYFELLKVELSGLQGFLTEGELGVVLNTTCSPVWNWCAGETLASSVADDLGIESLNDDTPMGQFVRKLSTLTQVQCLALVDACERIWRNLGVEGESLVSTAERCGLRLA